MKYRIIKKILETGKLEIDRTLLEYEIIENSKLKRISLTLTKDSKVTLSIPSYKLIQNAKQFLQTQRSWIATRVNKRKNSISVLLTEKEYKANKKKAFELTNSLVNHFNKQYKFVYKKISIRNQTSRWGSASKKGTLTFNVRILFLPEELQNYLVVHELCHLKEMNHSSKFWTLVAFTLPNYKALRRELRRFNF